MSPEDLISGIMAVVKVVSVSRETLARNLEELAQGIRDGKHIPDSALRTAHEDQVVLDELFNRS